MDHFTTTWVYFVFFSCYIMHRSVYYAKKWTPFTQMTYCATFCYACNFSLSQCRKKDSIFCHVLLANCEFSSPDTLALRILWKTEFENNAFLFSKIHILPYFPFALIFPSFREDQKVFLNKWWAFYVRAGASKSRKVLLSLNLLELKIRKFYVIPPYLPSQCIIFV